MPESLIITAGQDAAVRYAKLAMETPGGIIVRYKHASYPHKDATKKAARALQMAFSGAKKKARRQMFKIAKLADPIVEEPDFRGPYDHLGAYLRETSEGWEVRIIPGFPDTVEVVSAETGKPLEQLSAEFARWEAIVGALVTEMLNAQQEKRTPENPLDPDTVNFALSYKPTEYLQILKEMNLTPTKETAK